MFLSEMSEAKQNLIEIKDFDGDAIQDLVHFAYSSKLTLTVDNVQPLLYAACILQVRKHTWKQTSLCVCLCHNLFSLNLQVSGILYYLALQNILTL